MSILIIRFVGILLVATILVIDIDLAEGHLIGTNVITKVAGNYEVRFQMLPLYPSPEQPTTLGFSVLDQQGYNVWNMEANIKIQKDGNIIFTSPKEKYEISDFYTPYMFPETGSYQVILEASIPEQPEMLTADFDVIIGQETDLSGITMILLTGGVVGGITGALFLMRRAKSSKGLHSG